MTDRKNNLKNLIKKALVSTSTAALLLTGSNALAAAVPFGVLTLDGYVAPTFSFGPADNTWQGITAAGVGTGPAINGPNNQAITAQFGPLINQIDADIATTITAFNINNNLVELVIYADQVMGAIVNDNAVPLSQDNVYLNMRLNGKKGPYNLTFTGIAADPNDHGFFAKANDYSAFREVNLDMPGNVFNITAADGGTILFGGFNQGDFNYGRFGFDVPQNVTLNINTPFTSGAGAFTGAGPAFQGTVPGPLAGLNVADGVTVTLMTDANQGSPALGLAPTITTFGPNCSFIFDTLDAVYNQNAMLGFVAGLQPLGDLQTQFTFNLYGSSATVSNPGQNIGESNTNRVKSVTFQNSAGTKALGAGANLSITNEIYAETITLSQSGVVTYQPTNPNILDLGAGGKIVFAKDGNGNGGNGTFFLDTTSGVNSPIDFAGNNGTFQTAGGAINDTVDNTVAAGGVLIVGANGGATVADDVGGTNPLSTVQVANPVAGGPGGAVTFNGAINANNLIIGSTLTGSYQSVGTDPVNVVKLIIANTEFQAAGILNPTLGIDGNVDFGGQGNAVINLPVNQLITGTVDSSNGTGGVLNLGGNNVFVTPVGATNPLAAININGNNTTTVALQDNVAATNFTYTSTGIAVVGGTLTSSNVNFGNYASTLTFNGGGSYTFSSPVSSAGAATLNVDTTLTATDPSIGTIQTINIGLLGTPQAFTIAVNQPTLSLLAAGGVINFSDPNSALTLQPGQAQTVTFNGNLDGAAGGGGILTLNASGGTLKLQGAPGTGAAIGANNFLTAINVIGDVGILGGADSLNVSGTQALNLAAGSILIDASLTTVGINKITIGTAAGSAEYAIDILNAPGGVFNLNSGGIVFGNAASILGIQSSAPAGQNTTITLQGNIDPGNSGGAAGTGILGLKALNAGETLTVAGAFSLGTAVDPLQELLVIGSGSIVVQQPSIYVVKAISTGVTSLTLGNINVGVNFTGPTDLTIGTTGGNIALNNQAGIVNLSAGNTVNGTIDGSSTAILNFLGAGTVTGEIGATNALAAVNINGAGVVDLDSNISANTITYNAAATLEAGGISKCYDS